MLKMFEKSDSFVYFVDEFLEIDLEGISCILP